MSARSIFKTSIRRFLSLFKKDHLLEIWQIKRNEQEAVTPIMEFYKSFISSGMKIIDVGANVGTYSKAFIAMGARVVGLEPQKYCQSILKKRFKRQEGFKLISAAAGSGLSTGEIHKSASHTIASMNETWINRVQNSKRFWGEKWTEKEEIEITTLDHVISENFMPDYIKIDVEGYEAEVLKGLSRAVNYISFEITLPEMKEAAILCVNEVRRLGNYLFCIPEKNIASETDWKSGDDIILHLKELSESQRNISNDIFCKLIKD